MTKRKQLLQMSTLAMVLLLGVFGCSKQQDRFDAPPWLGGSNIETLQKRGNYTIFLKLMDKAAYTIPITKQLFTLFVPDDEAFKAYFKSNGISSVEDLSSDQAMQLFTLHVLPNPRSRFQLIYEYLFSELQGPDGEYASLFFRKPTNSTTIPYKETVKYYPAMKGQELLMSTGIKLMPLFSKDYFEDFFGATDGSDYLFMYPGSKWETGHGDMNWGNAMVTESEVRTSNGFIYFIDQVVSPLQNIDEYLLNNQDKYGLYYDILQRFATYFPGGIDKNKNQLYIKGYNLVSNLAEEQGAFVGDAERMKDMFTLFLPSNQVLQDYLNKTVLKTYSSLDEVPMITLYYILQTQIGESLGLISKISNSYFDAFGSETVINKSDIRSARMCSNGVVYEMDKILEPNVFTCVPGTLFFEANYSTFLYALKQSGLLNRLSNPNFNVTLFAPTNAQLEAIGIRYEPISSTIQYKGKDTKWNAMKDVDLNMFVQDHIYNGILSDLNEDQYVKMSSGNFIHIANGWIQSAENQRLREKIVIDNIVTNDRNGILNKINIPIKSNYVMGKYLVYDKNVSKFKDLLVRTRMLDPRNIDQITRDTIPRLRFLEEADSWTGLIPSNEAMDKAESEGLIPTNNDSLKSWLQYHFIRKNVIFDNGKASGEFPSQRVDLVTTNGTQYSTLKIRNVVNNLSVEDHSGQIVSIDHSQANILVREGVVHKINSVLKY
ncbi:MAG: fasciclin domain-containing protein [Prolixibacteraceae bacterium]|nr:fasciclin domain-containing protein [Prolixibacteraceae bacterium]